MIRLACPMRVLPALLLLCALPAPAAETELRPSACLLQAQPDNLQPGRCVIYEETGSGGALRMPEFFVRGRVVAARVEARHLAVCPAVTGREIGQYSREEFNRLAGAAPCVSAPAYARDVSLGIIRLRVDRWETPHARRAANAGRLYRGMFIDTTLAEGREIELEADLLRPCAD